MSKPLKVFEAPLTGISLVEASAGTGKTYNITSLYVRAILELNLEPDQILVMTFTEAATAELKSRLRGRLKESLKAIEIKEPGKDDFLKELLDKNYKDAALKLKKALENFDESSVFTIHGFCNRLLSEYSLQFDVNPNFEILKDTSELLQDCVDDYWRAFLRSTEESNSNARTLNYLIEIGFGPDDLRNVLDFILKYPHSRVVPENISTSDFEDIFSELETTFGAIRNAWKKEGKEISELYWSGNLNGQSFKLTADTVQKDWKMINEFVESDSAVISVWDRLYRFGNYMREKGSTNSFTVPDFEFNSLIEQYVELLEELKYLKPAFIKESVEEIRHQFEYQKSISNLVSYDDLLQIVEKGLREDRSGFLSKNIREKYPLALVDEFQDTDPIQYNIFRTVYYGEQDTGLFMIGDPKQAIYAFRGADIFTYLEAKSDADKSQSYSLRSNFRSNEGVIEGVNSVFSYAKNSFLLEDLNFESAEFPHSIKSDDEYIVHDSGDQLKPLQFITLNDLEYTNKDDLRADISEIVAGEVNRLLSGDFKLKGDPVQEKDIAILVRTGYEGEEIQDALRSQGINSVLRSRKSVFKTKEGEELYRILSAVLRPGYEGRIRSALATTLMGYNASDLLELNDNEAKWSDIISSFTEIKQSWTEKGIETALDLLLRKFGVTERISNQPKAERRISNLSHISELLSKTAREQHLNPKGLLKWFFGKANDDSDKAGSDEEELRLESDEDLIQITTIHASKGLEYPIVFCPFLWSSRAKPDKNSILKFYDGDSTVIDISQNIDHETKTDHKRMTEHQNRSEDVRLTYVALTRAVAACFVLLPNYKSIKDSPLAYMLNGDNGSGEINNFESIKEKLLASEKLLVRKPEVVSSGSSKNGPKKLDQLDTAVFNRSDVFNFPRMLSYSSLAGEKHSGSYEKERDEIYEPDREVESLTNDRFGFPKGAHAGNFLHQVFEDISFENTVDLEKLIAKNLEYYGIDLKWERVAHEWIKEILKLNLKVPDITLSELKDGEVLKEMEFFFPVEHIEPNELWKMIRTDFKSGSEEQLHGFMKGYIDLTFRHNGKYYILDYKSNYLGNTPEDYNSEALNVAMKDAGYDLQYHIYTVALHRFLSAKMKDYSYEKHFGGVLYLYLRGAVKGLPGSGVFYDKPEFSLIKRLDKYFKVGGK
ncbi:MAG: exodeoxyribonuclease V subunit beta [Gracilimonas sp.]